MHDKLHFIPLDQILLMHGLNPTKITKCYLVLKGIELLPSFVRVRCVRVGCATAVCGRPSIIRSKLI